jgi:hypothetical protein
MCIHSTTLTACVSTVLPLPGEPEADLRTAGGEGSDERLRQLAVIGSKKSDRSESVTVCGSESITVLGDCSPALKWRHDC